MRQNCCDDRELEELLGGTLGQEAADTLADHVAECATCQTRLEEQAADAWWWEQSREFVVGQPADSSAGSSSSVISIRVSHPRTGMETAGEAKQRLEAHVVDILSPPTHPELLGQLGKYQIECVIGQGGMGIVLKGFDTELNRTVAIKVLAPHLAANGPARKRFAREARAAAAVVHDHVIAIHGIETDGAIPYIVMPYVSGKSIQQAVQESGPFAVHDIVRVAMQIAAGLSAAHQQGLVHRDIKPANILLENEVGRVLITDFGLARAADDASITRSGLVAGTPHYMSPEQAQGESIEHRSDLFSLGSVIYFMATGRSPFRADGAMAVLHAICAKAPKSVREVNPDVPAELEMMINRLLQKEVSERFESAETLRKLLADYLAHLQVPTEYELPAELRIKLHPARSRKLVAGICVAAIGLGLLIAWPAMGWFGQGTDRVAEPEEGSPKSEFSAELAALQLDQFVQDSPKAPMAVFDQRVLELTRSLEKVARQWHGEATAGEVEQNWEQAVTVLRGDIEDLEREWRTTP